MQNVKNGQFGVTGDHRQRHHLTRVYMTSYAPLTETVSVLHHFQDIASHLSYITCI